MELSWIGAQPCAITPIEKQATPPTKAPANVQAILVEGAVIYPRMQIVALCSR